MPELELDDIQGMILSGYGHLADSAYLFVQITDTAKGKAWLNQIVDEITTARPWPKKPNGEKVRPATALNIAFTCKGWAALGVPEQALGTFSDEFKQGMAEPLRAELLGDAGDSDPNHWEMGGPNNEAIHVLLMLYAADETSLMALRDRQLSLMDESGVKSVYIQDGCRATDNHEHFGFLDGISQPIVEGSNIRGGKGHQNVIKAGEFILGYPNEYGLLPSTPTPDILGKNGSYLVCRKLAQDVGGFWNYVTVQAQGNTAQAKYLAAKMVGRWPNGAPLVLTPEREDAAFADEGMINDFTYAKMDHEGYACPVGSHIRRANPRDSLDDDPQGSSVTVNRHRLIRRGRSYGPKHSEQTASEPRGLMFIALNADLKRQFEFIQQTWLNDCKFNGLYTDTDPISGNSDGTATMCIQRNPIRRQLQAVPRFVTVRGGGYFFLPGIKAMRYILSGT